jgi:hypothetical protein
MNLGCWGEIVATYNPNTRVVFLCTHRGTLELSWPLEKEVPCPWLPEYSGAQILQESWKWLDDRHQPPSLSGISRITPTRHTRFALYPKALVDVVESISYSPKCLSKHFYPAPMPRNSLNPSKSSSPNTTLILPLPKISTLDANANS